MREEKRRKEKGRRDRRRKEKIGGKEWRERGKAR